MLVALCQLASMPVRAQASCKPDPVSGGHATVDPGQAFTRRTVRHGHVIRAAVVLGFASGPLCSRDTALLLAGHLVNSGPRLSVDPVSCSPGLLLARRPVSCMRVSQVQLTMDPGEASVSRA